MADSYVRNLEARLDEIKKSLALIPVREGRTNAPNISLECGKLNGILDHNGATTASIYSPQDDGTGGLGADSGRDVPIIDIGGVNDPVPAESVAIWAKIEGVRVFLNFLPAAKIQCGKTNASFDPSGVCSCSVWSPSPTGGLDADSGDDVDVVDIGVLQTSLPSDSIVYWCSIEGVRVLIAPGGSDPLPWGCILGKNTTGSTIPAWTVVAIPDLVTPIDTGDAPGMEEFKKGLRQYQIGSYSEEYQNRFGITQQAIPAGEVGIVRIRGLSYASIVSTGVAENLYAMPDGSGVLEKKFYGPCRIWFIPSGDGTFDAVIDVHSERTANVGGVLTSDLAPGGTATMGIYRDASTPSTETPTIIDKWGMLSESLLSGTRVFGQYDFDLRKVLLQGVFPTLKMHVGKNDATFLPNGTCTCSIWTPDAAGGLDADTGINDTVVDVGMLAAAITAGTPIVWASISNVNVLIGPLGAAAIPWGCRLGKNTTGTDIPAFTVVTLTDPEPPGDVVTDPAALALFRSGALVRDIGTYSNSWQSKFGITQEVIPAGGVGYVRVRGPSMYELASAPVNDGTKQYVMPDSGGVLKQQTFGPCYISYYPSSGNWVEIDVHSERQMLVSGRLAGNMAQGGTATLNIYRGCETSASESCTIRDTSCCLPSGGLTSTGAKKVFGMYEFWRQEAYLLGYQC